MTQYVVVRNTLPENVKFEVNHKCHKLKKSSGKLSYKITKDTSGLSLDIENLIAKKRETSNKGVAGTVANHFDLKDILQILQPDTIASSAQKLLPFIGNKNNAGFVTAVLIHLGVVRIK
ncbi:MAG: hypothetical protein IE909_13610 [Campylobacterales bacterium]|nr:hypothetical protein [Campylobacterales bacterium]